jgi:hypothetical protein
MKMITKEHNGNLVVCGDSFSIEVIEAINIRNSCFRLSICDPGYGDITKEKWDKAMYFKWMSLCNQASAACATKGTVLSIVNNSILKEQGYYEYSISSSYFTTT